MRVLILAALIGCAGRSGAGPVQTEAVDFAQTDAMLALLEARTAANFDRVMAAEGTALIVGQMNLNRRVSVAQYRAVLAAIDDDAAPAIEPVDDGERAARGVRGLVGDVWPALHWARGQHDLLRDRVDAIRAARPATEAGRLAAAWLPDGVAPAVRLHVVLGGRAGAAAIDHDIYFDVLATSFAASAGAAVYPSAEEIVAFFAHETHHVGMAPVIAARRDGLVLDEREGRAFDFVTMLVTEGAATYLINAHRDLDRMRGDPQYRDHLADVDALLAGCEDILRRVLADGLAGEDYDRAVTPLLGSGFHSAGAVLFAAIERSACRESVLTVLRDPRQLLAAYNAARPARPIDASLADRIAHLGRPR